MGLRLRLRVGVVLRASALRLTEPAPVQMPRRCDRCGRGARRRPGEGEGAGEGEGEGEGEGAGEGEGEGEGQQP